MNVAQKMAAKKPPYLPWNEHIADLSNPKKFITEYPTFLLRQSANPLWYHLRRQPPGLERKSTQIRYTIGVRLSP